MPLMKSYGRMPVTGTLPALGGFDVSLSGPAVVDEPGPADRAGAPKVRDAVRVLDIRTIQKLNLERVYNESATYATYSSRSSLAAAVAYYTAELGSRVGGGGGAGRRRRTRRDTPTATSTRGNSTCN